MYYDQHVCGARIQELRKSKGYTQEALAEAIDIDAKRISKIERGVISASYNDMILFSEFFGVTLDYLIIGKRQDVDTMDFQVTPHQLRHTYITNLIYASVDPKTVQYLAGHENSKVTMDIYAKVKYNKPAQLHGVINRAIDTSKKD